jgi:hypothetical protein
MGNPNYLSASLITIECPLFPKAGVQIGRNRGKLGSAFGRYSRTMTDHLVESRHRIWGGIFDADKGVTQYPFSEPNLQFGSVRPLQIMENN